MATQEDYEWLYGSGGGAPSPNASTDPNIPKVIAPAPPKTGSRINNQAAPSRPIPSIYDKSPKSKLGLPKLNKRARRRWIAMSLAAFVMVGVFYVIMIPVSAWGKVARIDDNPSGNRPAVQPGTTMLFVGTDSRQDLTPEEAERLEAKDKTYTGSRTDTIMLLHVPKTGKPVLISLPRDSFVKIPGHKKSKLNAAYTWGGPTLLIKTIEHNTGIRIDGYAEVGFSGFAGVVDAIGGIEVDVEQTIPSYLSNPEIKPGKQHLDTKAALWFVRNRNAQEGQDLGRMKRQRQFMTAAIKGAVSPSTILNPFKYGETCNALAKSIAVGQNTKFSTIWDSAWGLKSIADEDGYTFMVPISSANARTSAGSSVLWDEAKCKELFDMIAKGDTTGVEKFVNK